VYQTPEQVLFAHVVGRKEAELDLAVAALMVGEIEYPQLDISHYVAELDALAESVSSQLVSGAGVLERVRVLGNVLFQEAGFRGNAGDYYDPKNSFLNEVIDRRLGIPITLAVVYIEVGRRIGLVAGGLNFPGHFLVRVENGADFVIVDPFHGGMALTIDELRARLKGVLGPSAELGPDHLVVAAKRDIISRMLNNLAAIYRRADDVDRAVAVLERQEVLHPDNLRLINELAQLRARAVEESH